MTKKYNLIFDDIIYADSKKKARELFYDNYSEMTKEAFLNLFFVYAKITKA